MTASRRRLTALDAMILVAAAAAGFAAARASKVQPLASAPHRSEQKNARDYWADATGAGSRSCGDNESQMRTVKSPEHEARRVPSGLKATAWT
jgi:hypothetical protein